MECTQWYKDMVFYRIRSRSYMDNMDNFLQPYETRVYLWEI